MLKCFHSVLYCRILSNTIQMLLEIAGLESVSSPVVSRSVAVKELQQGTNDFVDAIERTRLDVL